MLGGLGAAGLILASPAWACSPNASIFYPGHVQAAPVLPGGTVTVEGELFNSPDKGEPVEILWNSMVGPPIATAPGLSFSVQVPIPVSAVPGEIYYINAVQRSVDDPDVRWKSSVPIEIAQPPSKPEDAVSELTTPEEETSGEPALEEEISEEVPLADVTPEVPAPTVIESPAAVSPVVPAKPQSRLGDQASTGPVERSVRVFRPAAAVDRVTSPVAAGDLTSPSQTPVNPVEVWQQRAAEPGPSLFEPVEGNETPRPSGAPVGASFVGLGLMAIVGAGVVAGQKRLALAAVKNGTRAT